MSRFPVLKENKDFRSAYYRGKSCVDPLLITYARKNRNAQTRVGITVSKKVGKAVQRNRCRRIIREAYAALKPYTCEGYDLVFVARGRTPFCKTGQILQVMERHMNQLRLLQEKDSRRDSV